MTSSTFGYDDASRLNSVSDGTNSVTYAYLANSPLLATVTFKQNGATRMTTTRQHDFLNRLQSIGSVPSGTNQLPVSFSYQYNDANQRIRCTLADGSFWVYDYDALGQVVSGKRFWSDGTPVAGQQFEYGFDDIGNRTSTKAGGGETGANLRSATYTATLLNQYTNRTVPGAFDVLGIANATNSVLVNGSSGGVYRKGEYFRKEFSVNNTNAIWQNVSVTTSGGGSSSGNAFVPATPEVFVHDADGNLTQDGRFTYTWDAENRLTKVESLAGAPQASKRKVTWEFDAQGRRVRQTTYDGSSGSYIVTEDLRFLADGWRHLAELAYGSNVVRRAYAWGLDLGGSLDAAGGVGGLLWMSSATNGTHFAAYDGNGNVTALAKASDGSVSANYEFVPFGEPIRASGSAAKENPFRFSTKRANDTGDLVLYENRTYSANAGKWLSRDPDREIGFLPTGDHFDPLLVTDRMSLYNFVQNNAIRHADPLGLMMRPDQCNRLVAEALADNGDSARFYRAIRRFRSRPCKDPNPKCKFCTSEDNVDPRKTLGFTEWSNGQVIICAQNVTSPEALRSTLLHELQHSMDDCMRGYTRLNPNNKNDCMILIWEELRAYKTDGSCSGKQGDELYHCLRRRVEDSIRPICMEEYVKWFFTIYWLSERYPAPGIWF